MKECDNSKIHDNTKMHFAVIINGQTYEQLFSYNMW
jgi:hypothetical protein